MFCVKDMNYLLEFHLSLPSTTSSKYDRWQVMVNYCSYTNYGNIPSDMLSDLRYPKFQIIRSWGKATNDTTDRVNAEEPEPAEIKYYTRKRGEKEGKQESRKHG